MTGRGRRAAQTHERQAVLAGRQPLLLDAVEQTLGHVPLRVLAKLGSAEDASALAVEREVDLLVVDVEDADPSCEPLRHVRAAVDARPALRVVVLGASEEPQTVDDAFAAGATSYVLKRTRSDDLAMVVRQLLDPSVYHAPPRETRGRLQGSAGAGRAAPLTRREHEILSLVVEGHTNGEIARELWVTEQTVKFHLGNVYRKLGVVNRTQASFWAHGLGIVVPHARSGAPIRAAAPSAG